MLFLLLGAPCCMYVTASNSGLLDSFKLSIARSLLRVPCVLVRTAEEDLLQMSRQTGDTQEITCIRRHQWQVSVEEPHVFLSFSNHQHQEEGKLREAYSDKVAQRQHLDDVRVKRDGELDDIPQPQKIEEAVENHTLHVG